MISGGKFSSDQPGTMHRKILEELAGKLAKKRLQVGFLSETLQIIKIITLPEIMPKMLIISDLRQK